MPTRNVLNMAPALRHHLEVWKTELGHLTLADLTPACIAEVRDKLAREPIDASRKPASGAIRPPGRRRSPATMTGCLATLAHALSVAVREWGWPGQHPVARVRKPPSTPGRTHLLKIDERGRLLAACRAEGYPHRCAAVVLALATGMRRGKSSA